MCPLSRPAEDYFPVNTEIRPSVTTLKEFVRRQLEYAITAWRHLNQNGIDNLERVQHRATRRMSDVNGTYPKRLLSINNTLAPRTRREFSLMPISVPCAKP